MGNTLNADLETRRAYPYAVGVRLAGEHETTYLHFASVGAADLHAYLMDTPGNEVTRWVAITEPEYLMSTVVPGWRQVS